MEIFKIYQNSSLDINSDSPNFEDKEEYLSISDAVKSVEVKIEAARSGRINNNFSLYTPKAMTEGMKSFVEPFQKHLQSKHNGDAVGVIQSAVHTEEFFPTASKEFLDIVKDLKRASELSDGKGLAKASRALKATKEYNSEDYKGLGIARIQGVIYDPTTIYNLRTGDPMKGQVSIGGKSKETFCSICGNPAKESHMHKRGRTYAKEVCFYIHNDLQLDHCGFVSIPADRYTNTQLIEDSLQEDLTMSVTKYNKQDNSAELKMNLAALKQKIKDQKAVEALITEYVPDEKQALEAKRLYTESLEDSRPNHFLIGSEELLNIKSPVGMLIAEKLLGDLEDGSNKEFLRNTLESALTLKDIKNIQETVDELLKVNEDQTEEAPKEEPNKNVETTVEDPANQETIPGEPLPPLSTNLTDEALQKLSERISTLVDEKLKSREESLKVEDSLRTEYTKQEITTLRKTLEADQTALKDISKKYRQSLVSQIILLKEGKVSEAYKASLDKRSVDQLQSTIEDLREASDTLTDSSSSTKEMTEEADKEVTTVPQKTTTEEAVLKVEDQTRDLEVPENTETPNKSETEDKVSDKGITDKDNTDKEEVFNVSDGLTPEQAFYADCKTMGIPKALKKHKQNLSNK